MWIARWAGIGFAIASLLVFAIAITPLQVRADGGGGAGIRFPTPTINYDEDEDEDKDDSSISEPEPVPTLKAPHSAYVKPLNFELSYRAKFAFGSSFRLGATYREESNSEEPTTYTVDDDRKSLVLGRGFFIRPKWRFPESYYFNDDEGDTEDEPVSSTPRLLAVYKITGWVNNETLENLDEEKESVPAVDPSQIFTSEKAKKWLEAMDNRLAAAEWLGDDAFQKFQSEFGSSSDALTAPDFSDWGGVMYYCGGACVGFYY